ncbi:hypothetical protein BD770DRAFT_387419 [Pilaira anomala]|nr:hypothetical protein BD770DRAFT_387419 [Pilaira anomala]
MQLAPLMMMMMMMPEASFLTVLSVGASIRLNIERDENVKTVSMKGSREMKNTLLELQLIYQNSIKTMMALGFWEPELTSIEELGDCIAQFSNLSLHRSRSVKSITERTRNLSKKGRTQNYKK